MYVPGPSNDSCMSQGPSNDSCMIHVCPRTTQDETAMGHPELASADASAGTAGAVVTNSPAILYTAKLAPPSHAQPLNWQQVTES